MQESVRRVVTGHDEEGKAIFISDGTLARHVTFDNLPELEFSSFGLRKASRKFPLITSIRLSI